MPTFAFLSMLWLAVLLVLECTCATPAELHVFDAPPVGLNETLSLAGVTILARRFSFPACIVLPASASLFDTLSLNITVFAASKAARQSGKGVGGVLGDSDLLSGVNGLSNSSEITVTFGRALKADDFVVLVDLKMTDAFVAKAMTNAGAVVGTLLKVGPSGYGPVPPGTSTPRLVPSESSTGAESDLAMWGPRAVAFTLGDFALSGMALTSDTMVTRIQISRSEGLDLAFVGLVDPTARSCSPGPSPTSSGNTVVLSTMLVLVEPIDESTETKAVIATETPTNTMPPWSATTITAPTAITTALPSTSTLLVGPAAAPSTLPGAVLAGAVGGAVGLVVLVSLVLGAVVVCMRRRQSGKAVAVVPTSRSEYGSVAVRQPNAYDDITSARQPRQPNEYESALSPLSL